YRGAAPVQYAVINGDKETGVTIMKTEAGVDTGDILAVESTPIGEYETAGELFDRLSLMGARLLVDTLDKLEKGLITPVKQDDEKATYGKSIKKENAKIDFSLDARTVKNLVYGMNPWPVAWTTLSGKILKIYKCKILRDKFDRGDYGEVVAADADNGLIIKCGEGLIEVTELQLEGGKKMSAHDFLLGRRVAKGDKLI
ncbi:MAG: methionyl-tRNA formyltransferase, partial [Clostridia bacterium]|nr:methionyl-tRNA formyltransferase [Clostridia bacterium]